MLGLSRLYTSKHALLHSGKTFSNKGELCTYELCSIKFDDHGIMLTDVALHTNDLKTSLIVSYHDSVQRIVISKIIIYSKLHYIVLTCFYFMKPSKLSLIIEEEVDLSPLSLFHS